jgi:hypothetical protein
MWSDPSVFGLGFCRNLLQDKDWPWVADLCSQGEIGIMQASWENQHGIR